MGKKLRGKCSGNIRQLNTHNGAPMPIPTYRHSQLETFEACPFHYGARLLCDVGADGLDDYLCPAGRDSILEFWTAPGAPRPIPQARNEYATAVGQAFHRFAHAYGHWCRENGISGDEGRAEAMAEGFSVIDGRFRRGLRSMMQGWAGVWRFPEIDTEGDGQQKGILLTKGSLEDDNHVVMESFNRKFRYRWHADYAWLNENGELLIADWKSGMKGDDYDPRRPDRQLVRYALGFKRMFGPAIKKLRLQKWFVNPQNPCYMLAGEKHPTGGGPLEWTMEEDDGALDWQIITGPIEAIRACPDFEPNPGCWLCGFCDYALACPSIEIAHTISGTPPVTLSEARLVEKEVTHIRSALSAKMKAARAVLNDHVEQHGPIAVSPGTEYGARMELTLAVTDAAALIESARAAGRPVEAMMSAKDGHSMALYLATDDDPFAVEEYIPRSIGGVRWRLSKRFGEWPVGLGDDSLPDIEDPEVELAPQKERGTVSRLAMPIEDVPVHIAPVDSELSDITG